MNFDLVAPYVWGVALLAGSAVIGIGPVRKLIQVREAKHELKHGSAGFIRTTSGWFVIVLGWRSRGSSPQYWGIGPRRAI